MTIAAEELPIAAVRRVIIVIVIFVVDCEFTKFFAREFSPTSCTDWGENLKGSFTIGFLPTLSVPPSLGNDLILFFCLLW